MHGCADKQNARTIVRRLNMSILCAASMMYLPGCNHTSATRTSHRPTEAERLAQTRPPRNATIDHNSRGIPYATDAPAKTFNRTHHNVNFAPPPGSGADGMGGANGSDDLQTRRAAIVGLYGELLNRPAPVSGQFDGAGNMTQITAATEGACFDPDVSRDGTIMCFASTQHRRTSDIYRKSTSGRTITQLTSDPADDVMPTISPDATQVAFASNRSGNWDIYVMSTNGGPALRLTDDAENELHPTWSPDGRKIAYCKLGAMSGQWEIWSVDVETTATPQFLAYGLFPQWNPDPARSKIVFQRARERGSRLFSIWTIDYINGESMYPTEIVSAANAAVMHPAWSPDGNRIVFVTVVEPEQQSSDRPQQSDLWVISLDGTGRANLTNGEYLNLYPSWSSDGTVYFLTDRSGVDNIWAVDTGRTIELTPVRSGGMDIATAENAEGTGQ